MIGSRRRPTWSAIFFALLFLGVGTSAFQDLSRPEAWAYWKESYFSPTMTSSSIAKINLDGADRTRPALAISGTIGAASGGWLRQRLDEAHLAAGDLVLLSSPGGNLGQALLMGEIIRSHGLATAVGTADTSGRITRSYCASACVLVYAGGAPRYGIEGSVLVTNIVLNGLVKGDIDAVERVELGENARVMGNVRYSVIETAVGAQINGKLIHRADLQGGMSEAGPKERPEL